MFQEHASATPPAPIDSDEYLRIVTPSRFEPLMATDLDDERPVVVIPPKKATAAPQPAVSPGPTPSASEVKKAIDAYSKIINDLNLYHAEWGSLTMSSPQFAPPNYVTTGTDGKEKVETPFAFGLHFSGTKYFEEAGKTEGTLKFSERIFNYFAGSVTAQFTPLEQQKYETALRKQQFMEQEYRQTAQNSEMLQKVYVQDFMQQRADSAKARQMKIQYAEMTSSEATASRQAAQAAYDRAAQKKAAADGEVAVKQALYNSASESAKPAALAQLDTAKAAATGASQELQTASDALTEKKKAESDAVTLVANSLSTPVSSGSTYFTTITPSGTYPETLGAFTAPTPAPAGTSTAAASAMVAAMPNPSPTNISNAFSGSDNFASDLRTTSEKDAGGSFPARSRIIEAAGNKTIQDIFDFLGDPAAALQFKDKTILFAVASISIDPGWRTQQGYEGHIDVIPSWEWRAARPETAKKFLEFESAKTKAKNISYAKEALTKDGQSFRENLRVTTENLYAKNQELSARQADYQAALESQKSVKDWTAEIETLRKASEAKANSLLENPTDGSEQNIVALETELKARIAPLQQKIERANAAVKFTGDKVQATLNEIDGLDSLAANQRAYLGNIESELARIDETPLSNFEGLSAADDMVKYESNPFVMAVSPLMERQALDLTSSRARQDEIALFLSVALAKAGMKGQGEIFNKWVKMRRQDAATRSATPVANSYSASGGAFGFNIGTRFEAIDRPGGRNPKAGRILAKETFPVLFIIGFARDEVTPRRLDDRGNIITSGTGGFIAEPFLKLTQTSRWTIEQKRGVFEQTLRSVFLPGTPGRPQQKPSSAFSLMQRYYEVKNTYKDVFGSGGVAMATSQAPAEGKGVSTQENRTEITTAVQPGTPASKLKILFDQNYEIMSNLVFGNYSRTALPVEMLFLGNERPAKQEEKPPVRIASLSGVYPAAVQFEKMWQEVPGALIPDANSPKVNVANFIVVGANLDQVDTKLLETGVKASPNEGLVKIASGAKASKEMIPLTVTFQSHPPEHFQFKLPAKDGEKKYELFSPVIATAISGIQTRISDSKASQIFVGGIDPVTVPKAKVIQAGESKGADLTISGVRAVGIPVSELARSSVMMGAVLSGTTPIEPKIIDAKLTGIVVDTDDPEVFNMRVHVLVPKDTTSGTLHFQLEETVAVNSVNVTSVRARSAPVAFNFQ